MSHDPLFVWTLRALDAIFPLDPAAIEESLPEDSDLALPEREHYTLSNGDTVTVDFYQISANCWTAKDADHDSRTGVDHTRELALQDLLRMCEADLEDDCDDGRARVVSEPQRRDAEFRRILARAQHDILEGT